MKKSIYTKCLSFLFVASLVLPLSVSFQSCKADKHNKVKYNKARNGGGKVNSNGSMGRQRYKKRYK